MRNEMFKEPLTSAEINSCIVSRRRKRGGLLW